MPENIRAEISLKDKLSPKLEEITKEVQKLERAVEQSGNSMDSSFQLGADGATRAGSRVRDFTQNLISAKGAISAVAVAMAVKLATSAQKASEEFETIRFQLEGVLGSSEKAQNRLEELAKFATETPFEMQGVAKASKILQTFGGDALATGDGLRLVGDAAAFAGENIDDLSIWIGRAYDGLKAGRPIGEAMARMQELALVSGQARNQIEELQKQGKNLEAWKVLEAELSKTSGTMKGLSETSAGLKSTLSDQLNMALVEMGDVFQEDVKEGLKTSIELIKELTPMAVGLAKGVKLVVDGWKELTLIPTFQRLGKIMDTKKIDESFQTAVRLGKKLQENGSLTGNEINKRIRAQETFLKLQRETLKEGQRLNNYQLTQLGFFQEKDRGFTEIKPKARQAGVEIAKELHEGFTEGNKKKKAENEKVLLKMKRERLEAELEFERELAQMIADENEEQIKLELMRIDRDEREHQANLKRIEAEQKLKEKNAEKLAKLREEEAKQLRRNQEIATSGLGDLSRVMARVFEKNKAIVLADAIVQGALAMQKAWASAPPPFNIPAVTATGIATAANIATIQGAKYEKGGFVTGSRHSFGGVPAELEGGEFVLSRQDVSNLGGAQGVQNLRTESKQNFAFNNTFNVAVSGDTGDVVNGLRKEVSQFARFFREEVVGANFNVGVN